MNTRAKLARAMTRGIDWPADAGATREPTRPHPAAGRHRFVTIAAYIFNCCSRQSCWPRMYR